MRPETAHDRAPGITTVMLVNRALFVFWFERYVKAYVRIRRSLARSLLLFTCDSIVMLARVEVLLLKFLFERSPAC